MFQIDIVEQCKANNRKAQMQLYKQYCEGMFSVAMRYVQNSDDAEDVVQESFIKAFLRIHQFKGEVTFGAWLKRIVINKSIDFLKAKRKKLVELDENYLHISEDEDWTVEVDITGQAERRGKVIAGIGSTFTIKRSDFGMHKYVENGALGDEVTIMIGLEGAQS